MNLKKSEKNYSIETATSTADLTAVRALCREYRDFLFAKDDISEAVTSAFHPSARYEALLTSLPDLHARPFGLILLARAADGTPIGCGMSHPLNPHTSEIKRVFVSQAARGKRVADRICTTLIEQARADRFTRVVLDTHKVLHSAQRLYERLGFVRRGPYQEMPEAVLPELVFYEKSLSAAIAANNTRDA